MKKKAFEKLVFMGATPGEIVKEFACYGDLEKDMLKTIIEDDSFALQLAKELQK